MVAFGDMILFLFVAGFLSLAPTWFLLNLLVEKAPRAVLATELRADRLVFLSGVEQAMVGFGTPRAIGIAELAASDARALLDAGELPAASIGAKVTAALRFVEAGGREAIITTTAAVRAAVDGRAGTRIRA